MKKLIFILIFSLNFLIAQDISFKSKEYRTSIIELYTSQGCSSCPSADKWLSKLKIHPKLFDEFIPMAFHVTYWNYIGWKDIFSQKTFDNRQKYYAQKIWKNNSVYTPQFVINTKEYRKWFYNKSLPSFKKLYGGDLELKLSDNILDINYFNKNIEKEEVGINIVILGFDYSIPIKRGENKHKVLNHDFVVLKHIYKNGFMSKYKLNLQLDISKFIIKDNHKIALVVFIDKNKSNILQSTGGYL